MSDKSNFIALKGLSGSSVTAVLLMGTILVGCTAPGSGPGPSRYEPTYLRVTEEQQFAQALRKHYLELATNAFDRGDSKRSDFYSLRALMAAEGKLAEPGIASRSVPPGSELIAAGERLSAALSSGARTGSPDLAARAQAAYDCWLVETGGSGDAQIAQSCRYNALNALTQLEGGSTGTQQTTTAAAGHVQPQAQGHQTQSYVVEPGNESQVINAPGGYTIQIITQQTVAPQHHITVPARFTTVEHPIQSTVVQSSPAPQFVTQSVPEPLPIAAPTFVEAVPTFVETTPIAAEIATVDVPFEAPAFDLGSEPLATIAPEPAPFVQEAALAPTYVQPAPVPFSAEPTIDLGPIEAVPVFNTAPVETIPLVEIAALPPVGDASANALIDAAANSRGDFSVFFGFDSDEVTLEGEDVLIDAIEQIRLSGIQRVTLMGFTDSVGNVRYNQLLAMRRAQAVRQFLQQKLGTAIEFEILPVGELQAVRNGGDGVKEALNRKVEIGFR